MLACTTQNPLQDSGTRSPRNHLVQNYVPSLGAAWIQGLVTGEAQGPGPLASAGVNSEGLSQRLEENISDTPPPIRPLVPSCIDFPYFSFIAFVPLHNCLHSFVQY